MDDHTSRLRNVIPSGRIREDRPRVVLGVGLIVTERVSPSIREITGRISALEFYATDLPKAYKVLLGLAVADDPANIRSIFEILREAEVVLGQEIRAAITAVFPSIATHPSPQEGLPRAVRDPSPISPGDGETPVELEVR